MIYLDESDTVSIDLHKQCTGWAAYVRGKIRCSVCGHRLTVNGVKPLPTRKMLPWKWCQELSDRRKAIAFGRRAAARVSR